MTAFFIGYIDTIKDPVKFSEYGQQAIKTIAQYGGQNLVRGTFVKTLLGDMQTQMVNVFEFPDVETIDNWYNSAEYQAIIPLRDEAADVTASVFNAL